MERFIILPEGTSSSTILSDMHVRSGCSLPSGTTLMLVSQTAGRGQRGNSWEAEPGANVTMSMLLTFSDIAAVDQFVISQLVSLAIVDTLREALSPQVEPSRVRVKWPNDIYVDDRKIAGILIENTLTGALVDRSIIGIGLNVNQLRFLSDAPNPVSIAQLTGRLYQPGPEALARQLSQNIIGLFRLYADGALSRDQVRDSYRAMLWRGTGMHPFTDAATGLMFMASIADIEPNGLLHLITGSGRERVYAFKEVIFAQDL